MIIIYKKYYTIIIKLLNARVSLSLEGVLSASSNEPMIYLILKL